MTLKDFITSDFLKTPTERKDDMDFYHHITSAFSNFIKRLEQVDNFEIAGVDNLKGEKYIDIIYKTANNLKNTIILTIQKYYDGKPAEAYDRFKNGIEKELLGNSTFNLSTLRVHEKLYRLRTSENGKVFEPKEIFHVPMNKRELIASQRFSIPGYPCLYLANSTYLAWLELGKPNIYNCHASRFEVVNDPNGFEPITLIDLTNNHPTLIKAAETGKWDGSVFRYLTLWPLIYATSVKVKFPTSSFKPEYIIPQLLMQYIKDLSAHGGIKIHGIKYSSTHYDLYNDGEPMYNIAIPIHGSSSEPFCNFLTKKFKFNQPISWESLNILNLEFEHIFVNLMQKEIKKDDYVKRNISLIPDENKDYNVSKFGIMEDYLESCDLLRIAVNGEKTA
ncbi:hypothetical protein ACT29H_16465 [Thermophagus sp. OGC60D27]|uniref:hypothetical protein n=1 Tax=Thermophagus sp. OGC60D27 TaxID=3458415 RepID=UPI00403835E5